MEVVTRRWRGQNTNRGNAKGLIAASPPVSVGGRGLGQGAEGAVCSSAPKNTVLSALPYSLVICM